MSRAYRELTDRHPELLERDADTEQRLAYEQTQWLADRAAQAEYRTWLDTLDLNREDPR